MEPPDPDAIYADHIQWLWRRIAASPIPDVLITGAVDSGKTTFFKEIVAQQPHADRNVTYAYWDLLRTPRARTAEGFNETLARVLRLTAKGTISGHLDNLPQLLNQQHPDKRVVLVLDHWDEAQESYQTCLDIDALEDLQQYVRSTQADLSERIGARLGLIKVTRFPTAARFLGYLRAHRGEKPGLVRLSGDMERLNNNVHAFPFLTQKRSEKLVSGFTANGVNDIVEACGGWPGLLVAACQQMAAATTDQERMQIDLSECVGPLLSKTLLPAVAMSTKGDLRKAWLHILRDIARGGDPVAKYALPTADGVGPETVPRLLRLPSAIRRYQFSEPLLLIDVRGVETLLTSRGTSPAELADGLFAVSESLRNHFAIPTGRVRQWRPMIEPLRVEDPRTRLVIVSNRPEAMVADADSLHDVVVVAVETSRGSLGDESPTHWRAVDFDIRGGANP